MLALGRRGAIQLYNTAIATLVWVLLLSCFGHVRAKTYFELPYRLELCLTFRLGLSSVILLLHRVVKGIVLLLVCSG